MHQFTPPIPQRPEEIELIRSMCRGPLTDKQNRRLNDLLRSPDDSKDAFIVKSASEWLEIGNKQVEARKLFGDFWLEGELCFLFADTNMGKSILAVQIGEALSRGDYVNTFERLVGGSAPPKAQTVLYFDFELSTKQFEKRYRCPQRGNYRFHPNFYRVVFNPNAAGAHKFNNETEYLNHAIENLLVASKSRVIIIDNITALRGGTQAAPAALGVMRHLQQLKSTYNLSVLVLAHTPKRNPGRPITRNDMGGSKMLINFADSAFAIGESRTAPGIRYLKQIKQRSGEETYGAGNICLATIIKNDYLKFRFENNSIEARHLQKLTEEARKQMENHILTLRADGRSLREVEAASGYSYSTVYRIITQAEGPVRKKKES